MVIQLDGHGAERLAMTFSGFIAAITQAAQAGGGISGAADAVYHVFRS